MYVMAEAGATSEAAVPAAGGKPKKASRSKSKVATTADLELIQLSSVLEDTPRMFPARDLWNATGAVLMLVRRPG